MRSSSRVIDTSVSLSCGSLIMSAAAIILTKIANAFGSPLSMFVRRFSRPASRLDIFVGFPSMRTRTGSLSILVKDACTFTARFGRPAGLPDLPLRNCLFRGGFCSRPRSRRAQIPGLFCQNRSSSRRLPRRDVRGEEAFRLYVFEGLTRICEDGGLAGILFPAPHGDIDIAGCKLNCRSTPSCLLSRDQDRSGSRKRVKDETFGMRRILDRLGDQRDGLHGRMHREFLEPST